MPTVSEVMDRVLTLEQELLKDREAKAQLEAEVQSLSAKIATLMADLPDKSSDTHHPQQATPAKPSEYDGNRANGRPFFNSVQLYISICGNQFPNDQTRILWTLSFMKSGRAATFANRVFVHESQSLTPFFKNWTAFCESFRASFYPLHEATEAMNCLESRSFHQGRRSVDEYIDEFADLVEKAGYSDGRAIVMKFRRGLDPLIQNRIANMIEGHPGDDNVEGWYQSARLVAMTKAANEAFSLARPPPTSQPLTPPRSTNDHRGPTKFFGNFSRPLLPSSPKPTPPQGSTPMEVDVTKQQTNTQVFTCRRCGKPGHYANQCPRAYDIRCMTSEERQDWIEAMLRDEQVAKIVEGPEEMDPNEGEDFVSCNE
jgi:hypothetical protein